jgi:hypothetical protein
MKQIEINSCQKMPILFECIFCDFKCCKKSNFDKHLDTLKHQMKQNETNSMPKNAEKDINNLECQYCSLLFNSRTTLWRHKKKCSNSNNNNNNNDKTQELVQYLMKENSEFKQLLLEQHKQSLLNAGHNTINSHNKTFNLQVFLNETCKNAINISDFINQLHVSISDLEETGRLGFSEGISKIFINELKQMDISDRPLHCSDVKRETIYIKDNNQWLKETDDKPVLLNAIKHVSNKNMKQISEWTKVNSDYNNSSSKQNDKYLKIVCESMSGSTKEESDKNYDKIVKNIVKQTIIDKSIIM